MYERIMKMMLYVLPPLAVVAGKAVVVAGTYVHTEEFTFRFCATFSWAVFGPYIRLNAKQYWWKRGMPKLTSLSGNSWNYGDLTTLRERQVTILHGKAFQLICEVKRARSKSFQNVFRLPIANLSVIPSRVITKNVGLFWYNLILRVHLIAFHMCSLDNLN